jgi:hypothetical protein
MRFCASHWHDLKKAIEEKGMMYLVHASGGALGESMIRQLEGGKRIGTLLADADFDAEWVHRAVRSHGIRTIIPATRRRPSGKPPAGRWRRRMRRSSEDSRLDTVRDGRRRPSTR